MVSENLQKFYTTAVDKALYISEQYYTEALLKQESEIRWIFCVQFVK